MLSGKLWRHGLSFCEVDIMPGNKMISQEWKSKVALKINVIVGLSIKIENFCRHSNIISKIRTVLQCNILLTERTQPGLSPGVYQCLDSFPFSIWASWIMSLVPIVFYFLFQWNKKAFANENVKIHDIWFLASEFYLKTELVFPALDLSSSFSL